jgi:glyoxylase-like metal-dependent hydrolase (beta-lactamase superfamily II)
VVLLICIAARNPGTLTGPGNNTWLLDGAEPTLIDAGVGHPEHLDELAQALAGRPLARVLVTHGHPDHASGVPALRERWPSVDVCAWTTGPSGDWRTLADGDEVSAGELRLTVVHTPGHAADHICFWEPVSRGVFCGDMMTATTTIMVPPASRGGSLREYLSSLHRLAALNPTVAWPGHGEAIADPVGRIGEYLAHRAMRERQVLACLAEGIHDPAAIVARVYVDIPESLHPAATLTVEALLEKIASEKRSDRT